MIRKTSVVVLRVWCLCKEQLWRCELSRLAGKEVLWMLEVLEGGGERGKMT